MGLVDLSIYLEFKSHGYGLRTKILIVASHSERASGISKRKKRPCPSKKSIGEAACEPLQPEE